MQHRSVSAASDRAEASGIEAESGGEPTLTGRAAVASSLKSMDLQSDSSAIPSGDTDKAAREAAEPLTGVKYAQPLRSHADFTFRYFGRRDGQS